MRFPSFIKVASYRRFSYEPRHYSTIESQSRVLLGARHFLRIKKRRTHAYNMRIAMLRLLFVLLGALIFIGYIAYGPIVLWLSAGLGLLIGGYWYFYGRRRSVYE